MEILKVVGSLIVGGVAGYFAHIIQMKISFKQKAIDRKLWIYEHLCVFR